jgi:hypothetical protein
MNYGKLKVKILDLITGDMDYTLLEYDAMQICIQVPTFWRSRE